MPQAQGEKLATYGLTEPAAGSDVRGMQTTRGQEGRSLDPERREDVDLARRRRRQLRGVRLDRRREEEAADPSGISCFIVERGFKGFSSGTLKEKWGILAGNTGFFKMDDMEVPAENMLGREGEGFKIAMFALDQGRFTVAAGATGLIRACRDASAKYALERKTFGQRDRRASAGEADDRAHGSRLPDVAPAVAASGLAEEHRPAQHAGDQPGEVVRDGGVGEGRRATRSRFTAPTAIRTSTRLAASIATARPR